MTSASPLVARVIVDSPVPQLDRPFDYLVPTELADRVRVGSLVKVPLRSGKRQVGAYVLEVLRESTYDGHMSSVAGVLSDACILPPHLYALARAVADRQVGTVADVLRQAIPRRYVRAEKAFLARVGEVVTASPRTNATRAVDPSSSSTPHISRWARRVTHSSVTRPDGRATTEWSLSMAELAQQAFVNGESSILVVPDHRDLERLCDDLTACGLGPAICRLDANIEPAERWVNFLRCATDEKVIVVGNRSAAYAPVSRPAMLAMWDDGDPVYAELLAPYSHARDVLLMRQERDGSTLHLYFDAPSTDLVRLVDIGWVTLDERASSPRAKIQPLDGQTVESATGIPSLAWHAAREALTRGPVLIQVARPGFASLCVCASCRRVAQCTECGGPIRRRQRGAQADCRWCGSLVTRFACADCGGRELRDVAPGSESTAEQLGKSFPGFRVVVSTGERPLVSVTNEPALIVSTPGVEPFCPGGYALVLVLDAAKQLMSERLRVTENAVRVWSHALHLASPGTTAYISGCGPELGAALATDSLWRLIERELHERESLHLPPAVRLATIVGSRSAVTEALDTLDSVPHYPELGPLPAEGDEVRVIIPFAYRDGEAVSARLRERVLARASGPRRGGGRPGLRVRLDEQVLSEP